MRRKHRKPSPEKSRSRPKTKRVHSAGGVVLRGSRKTPEVLLIATHGGTRWTLPKGEVEPGEALPDVARREVAEETGIQAEVQAHLGMTEYWYFAEGTRIHKFVDYFLMRPTGGQLHPQKSEVDDARWWPIEEALRLVTYPADRKMLQAARQRWQDEA